ncbi:DUF763 domain-containing protein [Patescibacteria group bacterium]
MRTGISNLPLHWGKAPRWLFGRMEKLAREITIAIISEYGPKEMLTRLSDPYWFQAFGCILGYDWHSSGLTTTTCGALKAGIKGLEKELDFFVAGGKGRTSRKTPYEIDSWAEKTNMKVNPEKLKYASKMSAKVDSAAIQDGYQLYHHSFFFNGKGFWTVIQQGMPAGYPPYKSHSLHKNYHLNLPQDTKVSGFVGPQGKGFARRYHWMSDNIDSFTVEPQTGICDDVKYQKVLNLTAKKSDKARKVVSEISKQKPHKTTKEFSKIITLNMPKREWIEWKDIKPKNLEKVLISTYERQPKNFEELLGIKGVGAKSLRALTLISELAYGTKADWNDPVKYSFAHGGKDGYPYPVDKATYDKSIEVLRKAVRKAKITRKEKDNCLIKLINM